MNNMIEYEKALDDQWTGPGKRIPDRQGSPSTSRVGEVDLVQENLIAYFRLFAGLPDITFVEEDDVAWCVNSIEPSEPPGNSVLRTRISGDSVGRRIDEIIGQFSQCTDHVDWLVYPSCGPADLGRRLKARGLEGGPIDSWMLADLASLPRPPSVADGFHVRYVSDDGALGQWTRVSSEGFGGDVHMCYDAYARHGFGSDAFSLHYIGNLHDEPVTSSTLLLAGGIAGIYDVSTPPAWRRQGFASAITYDAMREARSRGYEYAWIMPSPMGRSVYAKLGFVAVDFGIREYRWRQG